MYPCLSGFPLSLSLSSARRQPPFHRCPPLFAKSLCYRRLPAAARARYRFERRRSFLVRQTEIGPWKERSCWLWNTPSKANILSCIILINRFDLLLFIIRFWRTMHSHCAGINAYVWQFIRLVVTRGNWHSTGFLTLRILTLFNPWDSISAVAVIFVKLLKFTISDFIIS